MSVVASLAGYAAMAIAVIIFVVGMRDPARFFIYPGWFGTFPLTLVVGGVFLVFAGG